MKQLILTLTVIVGIVAAVTACETVKGLLPTKAQIETILAAQVAGDYTVVVSKDGKPLYQESWTCTQGPDMKLAGCHKEGSSPATPEVTPLAPAPKTLKLP